MDEIATRQATVIRRLYNTLLLIKKYQTPDQLRRHAEKMYGLSFEEALEMAYENIQQEAANAIKGMRRP